MIRYILPSITDSQETSNQIDCDNTKKNRGRDMKLEEYVKREGIRKIKFAERLGVSITTLNNILAGYDLMLSTALNIQRITYGMVRVDDLAPTKTRSKRASKKKLICSE